MVSRIAPLWVAIVCTGVCFDAFAQPPRGDNEATTQRFSPEVQQKAEDILRAAGLQVSGTRLIATNTAEIGRALSTLGRDKRKMKLVRERWQSVNTQIATINRQMRQSNVARGRLSMQLAAVRPGDASANNRIVGLLNANTASAKVMRDNREMLTRQRTAVRQELDQMEAAYTEGVLRARRELETLQRGLEESLQTKDVQTAVAVLSVNAGTPSRVDPGSLVAAIDRRLQKIEQEVFQEEIPLQVRGRSLFANVVINQQSIPMVVDTGASLICLPAKLAQTLGVDASSEDPTITLVMADGRRIAARKVTLDRVRVGTFEATDVDAAVLPPDAVAAEPLLGMTFLSNFRSEVNAAGRTLKLSRVE